MDDGEQYVDGRGGGDDSVEQSEERSKQPAAGVDRDEDRVVAERESLAGGKVRQLAERLGARA
jgi:hypothetical protein